MNILITGSNRGIGLEFVKQYLDKGNVVYATCRKPDIADDLISLKNSYVSQLYIEELDVCDDISINRLAKKLSGISIDILINNAGTAGESGVTIGNIDRENFLSVFEVNCLSVVKVCEAFLPNIELSPRRLITVISSRMGSITDNISGKSYAYRSSKAALNAVMRSFAIDTKPMGVNVLLLHPGWVKTRMGGVNGQVSPQYSVSSMITQIESLGSSSHAEVVHRFDNGEAIPY